MVAMFLHIFACMQAEHGIWECLTKLLLFGRLCVQQINHIRLAALAGFFCDKIDGHGRAAAHDCDGIRTGLIRDFCFIDGIVDGLCIGQQEFLDEGCANFNPVCFFLAVSCHLQGFFYREAVKRELKDHGHLQSELLLLYFFLLRIRDR